MATSPVNMGNQLDGPPMAPPGRPQTAPATASMGAVAPPAAKLGGAAFPQAIAEHAMTAERALASLAQLIPDLGPIIAQQIDQLRAAVGGVLKNQNSMSPGGMASSPMGMPGIAGQAGPQPSVGAGGPPMA